MQNHCIIVGIALALAGCQSTPEVADESGESAVAETAQASPAPAVSTESFDRVFLASVDVLREQSEPVEPPVAGGAGAA